MKNENGCRPTYCSNHQINISELKLVQQVHKMWNIEYIEAIHIHKHKHENQLNEDDGNIKSPLLELFIIKRRVDEKRPIRAWKKHFTNVKKQNEKLRARKLMRDFCVI